MKIRIYAIVLLLSFMAVLSHEMIPHHHDFNSDNKSSAPKPDHHSHHHNDGHHHHDHDNSPIQQENNSKKESHDHSFPLHSHLSVSNDFNCIRIDSQISQIKTQKIMMVVKKYLHNQLFKPPELEFVTFKANKPHRIITKYEPGAFVLRAPPFIA